MLQKKKKKVLLVCWNREKCNDLPKDKVRAEFN